MALKIKSKEEAVSLAKQTEITYSSNVVKLARKAGMEGKVLRELIDIVKGTMIDLTVEHYSVAVAYVLYHKFGYGPKRLPEILKEIENHFDLVNEGYVSLNDMRDELIDKIGIGFVKSLERGDK